MKTNLLLLAAMLMGCSTDGGVRKPTPSVAPSRTPSQVVSPTVIPPKEWERLRKVCGVTPTPSADQMKDKDPTDVAVDLANARKASQEECYRAVNALEKKRKGKQQ